MTRSGDDEQPTLVSEDELEPFFFRAHHISAQSAVLAGCKGMHRISSISVVESMESLVSN